MNKVLNFKDVLVVLVVAIIFGLFYKLVWFPAELLRPLGFQLRYFMYGFWFMAGPFAMLLIRKPGAGLLGEMGAALMEVFLAGGIGIQSFIYGGGQGLATEFAYMLFAYGKFSWSVTALSMFFTSVVSLSINYSFGRLQLETWALVLTIFFTFSGAFLIGTLLVHQLIQMLEKTGVVRLVRTISHNDLSLLK